MATAEIQVWVSVNKNGQPDGPIANALIDVVAGGPFTPPEDGRTNKDGFWSFEGETGHDYIIEVHADGFDSVTKTVRHPQSEADKQWLLTRTSPGPQPPDPDPGHVAPLVGIDGYRFVTATGEHLFGRVCSDFSLLWKLLRGEDIEPVLQQRSDYGFNMCRIFGMMANIPQYDFGLPPFKPQDYPNYYNGLAMLGHLLEFYGLYGYFSVFPDVQMIMPNEAQQVAHFNQVAATLKEAGNFILELTNEADAHDFNRVNVLAFTKPSGLLSCAGSYGEGLHPYYWDFYDFHPRRVYPAQITDQCLANNPNSEAGRKGGLGENDRLDGDRRNDAFRIGGTGMGTALFTSFHCTQGKKSEVFTGDTASTALAFLSGQLR